MNGDGIATEAWDENGTPRTPHQPCPFCGEDEIGSHFESGWCHACGWRGEISELRRDVLFEFQGAEISLTLTEAYALSAQLRAAIDKHPASLLQRLRAKKRAGS